MLSITQIEIKKPIGESLNKKTKEVDMTIEAKLKENQVKEMQFILKERIKKLKRDYEKKNKIELLIRIKEDRSLLQYLRKSYGNDQ